MGPETGSGGSETAFLQNPNGPVGNLLECAAHSEGRRFEYFCIYTVYTSAKPHGAKGLSEQDHNNRTDPEDDYGFLILVSPPVIRYLELTKLDRDLTPDKQQKMEAQMDQLDW